MKTIITFLLAGFILLNACTTTSKMKSPRKAHYKTKEGKKKQKYFNEHYKN
jgi:hypothetical protein